MKGRKKLPAKIHLLHGNPGHRAINDQEPKPESGIPKKPRFLSPVAKKYWSYLAKELHKAGILAKVDLGILASYCSALAALHKAETMIAESGWTQTTNAGEKKSPWVLIAKESRDQVRSIGSELGLSPTSRARIKVDVKENLNPFEAYRNKRA